MDPPNPVASFGDGMLLSEFDRPVLEQLLDAAGSHSPCTLLSIDLRHLGGALRRV
jgi:hypothetical protein